MMHQDVEVWRIGRWLWVWQLQPSAQISGQTFTRKGAIRKGRRAIRDERQREVWRLQRETVTGDSA
jgi:hypothetical protein